MKTNSSKFLKPESPTFDKILGKLTKPLPRLMPFVIIELSFALLIFGLDIRPGHLVTSTMTVILSLSLIVFSYICIVKARADETESFILHQILTRIISLKHIYPIDQMTGQNHEKIAASEILGCQPDASAKEISAQARKLLKKHHPDVAGDTPENKIQTMRIIAARDTMLNDNANHGCNPIDVSVSDDEIMAYIIENREYLQMIWNDLSMPLVIPYAIKAQKPLALATFSKG